MYRGAATTKGLLLACWFILVHADMPSYFTTPDSAPTRTATTGKQNFSLLKMQQLQLRPSRSRIDSIDSVQVVQLPANTFLFSPFVAVRVEVDSRFVDRPGRPKRHGPPTRAAFNGPRRAAKDGPAIGRLSQWRVLIISRRRHVPSRREDEHGAHVDPGFRQFSVSRAVPAERSVTQMRQSRERTRC